MGAAAVLIGLVALAVILSWPSRSARSSAANYWGGELTPVVSVKELMRDLIDPLSDNIFRSVGTMVDTNGIRDWAPRTDQEWNNVRIGGVAMAEASYLLKIPRPFAPPGDNNLSEGPDAPELSPDQIKAKLERDPVLWQAKVEALRNVGRAVLEMVDKRDTEGLWEAGEALDNACESCHMEFWYPGQKQHRRIRRP